MNLATSKVFGCFVFALYFTPLIVGAGLTYEPLVGIPGVDNAASNFNQYINQLYFVSISIAALLAVIKIIIGGVKWMLTDVVTQKSDAKDDIRGALLGLLLIISAYLILNTINPQLTNLNVLRDAPGLTLGQRQNVASEEYGPPAPANLGAAERIAPIVTSPGEGGVNQHSMYFNATEQALRTQTVTTNGVDAQVPVISMATYDRYQFQLRELRGLCGARGVEQTNPQIVIIQNERLRGQTRQETIFPSGACR